MGLHNAAVLKVAFFTADDAKLLIQRCAIHVCGGSSHALRSVDELTLLLVVASTAFNAQERSTVAADIGAELMVLEAMVQER
ncbi:hypothetical protein N9H93_02730 [Rhizobiaceae bacterium]|nr:hypothetical protein [Rhizobiaceae bacterium]